MNRRDFLKVGSVMSAFAGVGPVGNIVRIPIETAAFGKLYRGTHDGQVYVSADGGKSWQLQSNFGPGYSVLNLLVGRDKQLYAQIGFERVNFHLVLTKNGNAWATTV